MLIFLTVILCTFRVDTSNRLLAASKQWKELYVLLLLLVIFLNFSTLVLSLGYLIVVSLNNLYFSSCWLHISLKRSLRAQSLGLSN
jgi:hypothetical protein